MKQKGFTLVELLAVVAIIGFISLLVVTLVMHNIDRAREQAFDQMVENIENTTRLYIDNNRDNIDNINVVGYEFSITLQDLVDEGIIKSNIKNPKTGYFIPLTTEINIKVLGNNKYQIIFKEDGFES